MSDNWNHISSQQKNELIAKFKAFYGWMLFAKCMQVPDGKNKLTVKEFFKSLNMNRS
jgi:hypothetical protein